jgi:hypothetical protein
MLASLSTQSVWRIRNAVEVVEALAPPSTSQPAKMMASGSRRKEAAETTGVIKVGYSGCNTSCPCREQARSIDNDRRTAGRNRFPPGAEETHQG